MDTRLPTSVVLHRLLDEAAGDHVTPAWVLGALRERSFGFVMLLLGLLGVVPALSTVIAILLMWPAVHCATVNGWPCASLRCLVRLE